MPGRVFNRRWCRPDARRRVFPAGALSGVFLGGAVISATTVLLASTNSHYYKCHCGGFGVLRLPACIHCAAPPHLAAVLPAQRMDSVGDGAALAAEPGELLNSEQLPLSICVMYTEFISLPLRQRIICRSEQGAPGSLARRTKEPARCGAMRAARCVRLDAVQYPER